MPDPAYFECTRLHVTMRADRCDESRAAEKQSACVNCPSWADDQSRPVLLDLSAVTLSPASEHSNFNYRASISWKPDTTLTVDGTLTFNYRPQPMPAGYDRQRLMRESGVSFHSWDRYFAAASIRCDTYERIVAFLKRLSIAASPPRAA